MPTDKVSIKVLHTGRELTVRYFPEEYTVSSDNNFAVQNVPGLGSPLVQFVNGNQKTVEAELFFDTYDTRELPKQDVREQTTEVTRLMEIDGELHAPPVLELTMASLVMRCVLSRVSEHFILFMPDGVPVRARLTCTFLECVDPEQEAKAANLQTADFSKLHVLARGETLSDIAAALYDDPLAWRPIALANGIADPLAVPVGARLLVPSLPYSDPETGALVA
jgi:hypothetical protein